MRTHLKELVAVATLVAAIAAAQTLYAHGRGNAPDPDIPGTAQGGMMGQGKIGGPGNMMGMMGGQGNMMGTMPMMGRMHQMMETHGKFMQTMPDADGATQPDKE